MIGWISAYRPPARPDELFVWQVAVAAEARGERLGGRLLDALVARPGLARIERLTTTVTADNGASEAMFRSFARRRGATVERSLRFDEADHFAGAHASEWQFAIHPIRAAEAAARDAENRESTPA